jgi:DNA-binding IclR family transcriptional regulator
MQILYHIVSSGGDEHPPKGPVQISVADLKKRFPVSRSHVVKLLRDAERDGLLQRAADGQYYLTEKLREGLTYFQAAIMLGHAANAHRALQALKSGGTLQTATAI